MANGRTSETHFPLNLKPSITELSEQFQATKRKFQRVNQEIVKHNVALHDQLAKNRQEHHLVLQENIRLKGKMVALENKLADSESNLTDIKKSISERMDMLEAVGQHLIDVTKFLRMLSVDADESPQATPKEKSPPRPQPSKYKASLRKESGETLRAIKEEEPQTIKLLSENVADFSLDNI